MKAFITTVAGMATRFSKDFDTPQLKCIYNNGDFTKTLLYRLLSLAEEYDRLTVVGGFMFESLCEYTKKLPEKIRSKLLLVKNPHYENYGSGYSLYLGLLALENTDYEEILFAEGDLFFGKESFRKLCALKCDAVTVNMEPITADKSVAFYLDDKEKINYIYDTSHGFLEINKPFKAIYNSAQIWKFTNCRLLFELARSLGEKGNSGTNLVLINKYYQSEERSGEIKKVLIDNWLNCNTVADFNKAAF